MSATKGDAPLEVPEGWKLAEDGGSIRIRLKTKDFMSAVGLINEIARLAEQLDHHPDLHITGYDQLEVSTWSHDVGRLTERDTLLAGRINALLAEKHLRPL